MGNFKQNNRPRGRGNSKGFAGRNSGRPAMHKAVCSECGRDCEVPFKPTGDKPIFCADCFRRKRSAEPRRPRTQDYGRFSSSDKRMHKAVCDRCGKECEVPFKPTSDKPIYCSQCFNRPDRDKSSDQASRAGNQFEIINIKLDKILKALSPGISVEVNEKKKTIKKNAASKPKKASKSKAGAKKKK